jgi:hypothetical protein
VLDSLEGLSGNEKRIAAEDRFRQPSRNLNYCYSHSCFFFLKDNPCKPHGTLIRQFAIIQTDQRDLCLLREVVVVSAFITLGSNERHAFGLQCVSVGLVAE